MTELWTLSAHELAGGIARKDFSCTEVVEAHLRRIKAVNPGLNAIVKTLAAEARRDAAEADRKVSMGHALGPLHGVPFTIKENIDVAGFPTTWGVPAFAGAIPPVDAPVVERMRAAGAIPIGRTNLPDMGLRMHTDSSLHGLTRNPWNSNRTAAGSSGGDAVALAACRTRVLDGRFWRAETSCGVGSAPSAVQRRDLGRFGRLLCWRGDAWRPGQAGARTNIRFRFQAIVTRLHSPRTLSRPRNENWRNPSADLMMPNTGSGVCLRKA